MKVTNVHLLPNHTFAIRQLDLEESSAARAFVHKPSQEAILVRDKAQQFNPQPIVLHSWDELVALADPEYVVPKKVGRFAFFSGDNPFLMMTSAGAILPMPTSPDEIVPHAVVHRQWTAVKQASFSAKGPGAKAHQSVSVATQVIFAGIAALGAIAAFLSMLPRILERF